MAPNKTNTSYTEEISKSKPTTNKQVETNSVITTKGSDNFADLLSNKSTKDVLIDFIIIYLFVPFWITLFASSLKYIHQTYDFDVNWRNDIDLLIFPCIFILICIPLTYLRFQASNPSHFLHSYRVEIAETFIDETRNNLPSPLKIDILLNIGFITFMNLSGIFAENTLKQVSFINLYIQALVLLIIFDFGTYFGHRMVHDPDYYKYHKSHHNVRNTVAISLIDIDMTDFFVNNLPILILPFLFSNPIINNAMCYEIWIIGFAFIFAQGFIIHSDLYLISSRYSLGLFWGDTVISHSLHHSKNKGYYSFVSPQIWDCICQTQS